MQTFKQGEKETALKMLLTAEKRVEDLKQFWYFK
jgi:hypothetical protein